MSATTGVSAFVISTWRVDCRRRSSGGGVGRFGPLLPTGAGHDASVLPRPVFRPRRSSSATRRASRTCRPQFAKWVTNRCGGVEPLGDQQSGAAVGIAGAIGGQIGKRVAPSAGSQLVRNILERAIDGAGPIPGAAASGESAVRKAGGDTDRAIAALIRQHLRLAGAQGFLTNIGGLITTAVTMPLNIAGLIVVQCHLAAAILHVRRYDLQSPAVRDAVLVCLLDREARASLAKSTGLTMTPAALATGDPDPEVQAEIARAVTGQLLALSGGKQVARFVARRIPVLGGVVGGLGDAWSTRQIGTETARTPIRSRP